jgi:hypothetical protein
MATHKADQDKAPQEGEKSTPSKARPKCGIIMPIAGFGDYSEGHWADILRIIKAAADKAGFDSAMVSTGADIGVIHANIINNIYSNEIVVCDVSGKNANVMFELGLRLASKLPVIIIKDELTGYSFDTSPIQHLPYRSDLRLFETLAFQEDLTLQIKRTHESSSKGNYKPFLEYFGSYTLSDVEDKTVSVSELLQKMEARLAGIEYSQVVMRNSPIHSDLYSAYTRPVNIPSSSKIEIFIDYAGRRRASLMDDRTGKVIISDSDPINLDNCNEKKLRDAVNSVGNNPDEVKRFLGLA